MATKSVKQRVREQALMRMGPAQLDMLPGSAAQVTYTGKPGRPKGRKNNKTLIEEAQLETWGEKLIRERVRLGLIDPLTEAIRRVRELHNLPDDVDPRANFREEVAEFAKHFDGLKATEGKNALPYVRQKMPQQVDVTEKHVVTIVQQRMDDDGLPGDGARNVTPKVIDNEDGI